MLMFVFFIYGHILPGFRLPFLAIYRDRKKSSADTGTPALDAGLAALGVVGLLMVVRVPALLTEVGMRGCMPLIMVINAPMMIKHKMAINHLPILLLFVSDEEGM